MLSFPEKYYVGFRDQGDGTILGFATPYGTDKAFQKRKETVDNWTNATYHKKNNSYIDPVIYDNVPTEGFTFDKSVSRWSTSNKWFRINDPRGFQLEISAENLSDIILNGETKKGEILGKYVWGRNGNNYLTPVSNKEYQNFINPQKTNIDIGDVIEIDGTEYQYLGNFYQLEVKETFERTGNSWHKPSYKSYLQVVKTKSPVKVFHRKNSSYKNFEIKSSMPKKFMYKENREIEEMPILRDFYSDNFWDNKIFFENKNDMLNFQFDDLKKTLNERRENTTRTNNYDKTDYSKYYDSHEILPEKVK